LNSKGKLTEKELKLILTQILDAVNYCHINGVIHRDLKLENIVFSDETKSFIKVKLIFFLKNICRLLISEFREYLKKIRLEQVHYSTLLLN
jgi:serine/threonine protein kinase